MRIVLDTNILVRANPKTLPAGLARDLLTRITTGSHMLVLSEPLLVEVRRVLAYAHVQARWALSQETIHQYLSFLEAAGEVGGRELQEERMSSARAIPPFRIRLLKMFAASMAFGFQAVSP